MHSIMALWRINVWLHSFLILALDSGDYSASGFGCFTPGERPIGTPTTKVECITHPELAVQKTQNLVPLLGIKPRFLMCPAHRLVFSLYKVKFNSSDTDI
jgi:hypothetical protein